jgi:ribosomal protein S13
MLKSDHPSNEQIASALEKIANLLEVKEANSFRIRSYRLAAENILHLSQPVSRIYKERGESAITDIPGIGKNMAGVLTELIRNGRSSLLDRLQGEISPVALFTQLPGIGQELAENIVETLGIKSLEELELAAYDGRLAKVKGFGPRKIEAIQEFLAGKLSRSGQHRVRDVSRGKLTEDDKSPEPPVALLLDVDQEYRSKADKDELPKIAPKRFNPQGDAWLPVLHEKREPWELTALYSNMALAHRQYATHDWVVIYYEQGHRKQQCTVVTSHQPELKGKRVIRGREVECKEYYLGQH